MDSAFDFHTHHLSTPAGSGIVNLPQEVLLLPHTFCPEEGALYSAGIHPWWTVGDVSPLLEGLKTLLPHPQIVAIGECGLDRLQGASPAAQEEVFIAQASLAEQYGLPMTIHCVRAFDGLLAVHKKLRPTQRWTIHGFRGKPRLACQLLEAGFDLSFGLHFHPESLRLVPAERRHTETDDAPCTIAEVWSKQERALLL